MNADNTNPKTDEFGSRPIRPWSNSPITQDYPKAIVRLLPDHTGRFHSILKKRKAAPLATGKDLRRV